jgi:hypothetical protein
MKVLASKLCVGLPSFPQFRTEPCVNSWKTTGRDYVSFISRVLF